MYIAAEDIEAGTPKPKFQTEPTLPIYLKVIYIHFMYQKLTIYILLIDS